MNGAGQLVRAGALGTMAIAKVPAYREGIFVGTTYLFESKEAAQNFVTAYVRDLRILDKQPATRLRIV
jgi:hypothetical protein